MALRVTKNLELHGDDGFNFGFKQLSSLRLK